MSIDFRLCRFPSTTRGGAPDRDATASTVSASWRRMPAASGTATLLHSLASKPPSFTPAQPHALASVSGACTAAFSEWVPQVQIRVLQQIGRLFDPALLALATQ